MELRSRKRVAGGTEQLKEEEGGSSESGGSSDHSDVNLYDLCSSDSDWVSASGSDSEGEDNQHSEEAVINLNDRAKGKTKECLRKKGKVEAKNKRGQPSLELELGDYDSFDELQLILQKPVEIDFLRLTGKSKRRKSKSGGRKPILMWNIWESEHNRWIDENFTEDCDLDVQNNVVNEVAETPSDLIMPLLRYQKEWLAWALRQEESETRGGILADEMGMGKTIQAIALVFAKREINWTFHEPQSSKGLPHIKGTLVVCPVVAVSQWVSEIERFTSKGSAKILVYHGANRERSSKQFQDYDFVITTYSIVEADYRKHVMPPKEKCVFCGKLFYETKMSVHLKYFCGPNATRTEKQSKQQRKMHLPSKKTSESLNEKISGSSGTKNWKKGAHKGKSKLHKDDNMDLDDIERGMNKGNSVLHAVKWNRIILDEAHYIKSRRCNTAKAVLALESTYKWALSGTPLQNRVGELYSLVRFLQLVPYSYYLCKDCDCRTLDHSSTTKCSNCPHSSVRHFCWWNKNVATPIQSFGTSYSGKRAMILLKHKILKNIVLRRTKKGRAADLALPPRIVSLRKDTLDIKEQDYYESLYTDSQALFNTYVDAGTLMNNYAHIFDLLTRLRQAVDHPYLVVYSASAALKNGNQANIDNSEKICGICHDPAEDHVVTVCEHVFCKACLIEFSASLGQVSCPSCSTLLTVDMTTSVGAGNQTTKTTIKGFRSSSILNRIQLENFQTSTKIEALKEEIRFMVERDGSAKGIVFSQFTSFLDLIHYSLQKSGVNCVQLVGSMTMSARDNAIKRFTEDPDCRIFLMSLKAGGVALNLTVASHVFLMDPWWNPAVERQAQDRIHRIGQYKPIRIVRFVIENTIEERILKLQEKKELVFEGTIGGSTEAFGKLTEADLKFLFVT
ncbi:DNA repair protein RAD16 [Argentina anserina]|uniref:DNA repair protein RAD16 n=1 Tax=Argentina anserina TaxID=57926 RepID=UPI0021768B2B|nr:DNA repair protein RAD16 [Potentilla anserina]